MAENHVGWIVCRKKTSAILRCRRMGSNLPLGSTYKGRRFGGPTSLTLLFAALLEQFGDEAGPAGLMAGAYARTVVAVEVFVERNQIVPVRISLKLLGWPKDWPSLLNILQEDA